MVLVLKRDISSSRLAVVLLLSLFLGACAEHEAMPLRVGTNVIWPGYEPFYLARDNGYLGKTNIRLVEYSSSAQVIRAYQNGQIDAAALTLDEVLSLQAMGEKPRIVLVTDVSNGADMLISRANISTLKGLEGRRVGLENNALGAYLFSRMADMHSLNRETITLVPLEIDKQYQAFVNNEVDAMVTYEPIASRLLLAGGRLLFDSGQIPGEIVDVLVVREESLAKHGAHVHALIDGWFQSLKAIRDHPSESARTISKRAKQGGDGSLMLFQGMKLGDININKAMLGGNDEPALLKIADQLVEVMENNGLLQSKVAPSHLFPEQHYFGAR